MTFDDQRRRMVEEQLRARGLTDERLLRSFTRVPRHLFVPPAARADAYTDHPVPIGAGQTISQPYMVALMVRWLRLQGHERVLEIGTGSGYQAAILAELALEVYSVERLPELAQRANAVLDELNYLNIQLRVRDGSMGWPEYAPYDGIVVAAAVPRIPEPLVNQLAHGGRLVIPVGSPERQTLMVVEKHDQQLRSQDITACVFVPLIGAFGWPDSTAEETEP